MPSIWTETTPPIHAPTLLTNAKTEVAVIGAGIAGILTATMLQQQGIQVTVLDAGQPLSGMTCATTAKITSQHGMIYQKLIKTHGKEAAGLYAQAAETALEQYARWVKECNLDCTFTYAPAYLYTCTQPEALEAEEQAAKSVGLSVSLTRQTELPFRVKLALRQQRQAHFHPLRFLQPLASGLTLYQNTRVTQVAGTQIQTTQGPLTAQAVVFCCHFPFPITPGYYFARMHQQRSYVLALEHAAHLNGMYLDAKEGGLSFRSYGNYLLLGGAGHRTGKHPGFGCYDHLKRLARRYYPNSRVVAQWSAQDCIPMDGVPYIGRFSASTPNWYVATGFQKWGMTTAMTAAMMISDQITGKQNPWESVFDPGRFKPIASAKNLLKDTGQAISGLYKQKFTRPSWKLEELPPGHGKVVETDGKKVGVYKDRAGDCHFVRAKCPHLGCELSFNPDELSWDCPCHGSRYRIDGTRICGPAQEDISV